MAPEGASWSDSTKRRSSTRLLYLDQACGTDAALRGRVDALLRAFDEERSFLERPAVAPPAPAPGPETTTYSPEGVTQPLSAGAVIAGRYKLLQEIGEGGMGTVFMVEQLEPVKRRVALKLIKPGMDSRQVVARFEAERQALALMDHVNIARVFDGGTTENGRPYFVMELVRGVPITKYCDGHRLPLEDRLELFVDVCRAVQHAHQKGIIHRDLKPSNVLAAPFDGRPVVKVIDFGVAKAAGPALTDRTLFTGFGVVVGTAEYMSPEQAELNNADIDTRSDVYSLGVLLYELLTGTTPVTHQRAREASLPEVLRLVREEEPTRPSTRLSTTAELPAVAAARREEPGRLLRLVRGELDWIVLKALEKDRARRYETAAALAEDVCRFLADEPVQACPPSAGYRVRKFVRRNKAGVLTAAGVLLGTLLAAAGALAVQAAGTARVVAEQKQTQAANDRLTSALEREQQTLYFQRIALAARELDAKNVGRAEELLEECPAQLRDWEWHYLKHRRHREPVTIRGKGWATAAAFSPDGKYLACVSVGQLVGEVKVWDVRAGVHHRTVAAHLGPIGGVAFSPDGRRLATAGWDKKVKLWDVATGEPVHEWSDHTGYVSCVAFSKDGKWLASGGGDNTVRVWDAQSFQHHRTLSGHSGGLYEVAFGNGGTLASTSSDETVRVWDAGTGRELHVLKGHAGPILAVAFSRDGKQLASGGFDGTVKVWDPEAGRHVRTIRDGDMPVMGVAFSRNGHRVATASLEKTVRLWAVAAEHDPHEAITLRGHAEGVMRVDISPDGLQIASASLDGTVKVWDSTPVTGGPELLTLRGHSGPVFGVAFRPSTTGPPTSVGLGSVSQDSLVKLWDTTTGETTRTLRGHTGTVARLVFSADGRRLVTADYAGKAIVWEADTGKELRTLRANGDVALDPEGKRLAFASEGGQVRVIDIDTGKELIPPFLAHLGPMTFVTFAPDGKTLATGSWDQTVKLWDAATGAPLHTLGGHTHLIQFAAFRGDGRQIATASWDHTAKVWDAVTGKELFTLRGHNDRVTGVAFSPDGKHLATSSQDNTVRVWDSQSGKELTVLRGHTGYVLSVAFSQDGKRLASSGGYRGKGEVKVWDTGLWDKSPDRK
jgi:eukaryotic-like serine/threonine-protein kinase